jgi:hypothetical protein
VDDETRAALKQIDGRLAQRPTGPGHFPQEQEVVDLDHRVKGLSERPAEPRWNAVRFLLPFRMILPVLLALLAMLLGLLAMLTEAERASADQVRPNRADQATAQHDVLHLTDLPPSTKWAATAFNAPGSGSPQSCASLDYNSRQVVDTGMAKSQFSTPGLIVMNQVGLVAESSMVGFIWKHTFAQSLSRCLGDAFNKGAAGHLTVLSTTSLPVFRLAPYESAYRVLFQARVHAVTLRGAFDLIALAGKRTLSLLMVVGFANPGNTQAALELGMSLIDTRLAQIIAARSFPPAARPALAA